MTDEQIAAIAWEMFEHLATRLPPAELAMICSLMSAWTAFAGGKSDDTADKVIDMIADSAKLLRAKDQARWQKGLQ